VKRLTILSSAILLAGGWQLAQAQPPGGGGGGFTPPTFDSLNTDMTPGTANAGVQVLTAAEVTAYYTTLFAGRAGGAPGGGAPPAGGGAPPAGGGAPPAGGGGGFDPATIFGTWDTNMDGEVTAAEFEARPRRGGGGGRGAPGGAPPGGAPPAPPAQ
jgi:hypothetical protein